MTPTHFKRLTLYETLQTYLDGLHRIQEREDKSHRVELAAESVTRWPKTLAWIDAERAQRAQPSALASQGA
jgi:hypothetical protein